MGTGLAVQRGFHRGRFRRCYSAGDVGARSAPEVRLFV